jgi:hypothetical protein
MKKLLTIAFTGVLAVAALAVESDPSNTVGFISRSIAPGTYAAFSACPMGLGTAVPAADIIGGQGASGDRILKWNNFWQQFSWTPDATWGGLTLDYNGTYLYYNGHGVNTTLVVAGDVIPEGTDVTMASFGAGFNAFGNPLPMDIALDSDDLTLAADGFAVDDVILNWNGFWQQFVYNGATYGLDLLAGKSFIFKVATPFVWDYTVMAAPAASVAAPALPKVKAQVNTVLN